jgi:CHAT domain-containing protein
MPRLRYEGIGSADLLLRLASALSANLVTSSGAVRLQRRGLLLLFIALAVAAAAWTFVRPPARWVRWWDPNRRPELAEVVAVVQEHRLVEGRLTGGFQWSPPPVVTRGAATRSGNVPLNLQLAAARVARRAADDRSALNLAALGTTQLAMGHVQLAIETLEEAIGLDAGLGHAWSDLAVAYLARHTASSTAADVPRALDAIEHAMALGLAPRETRFNRALALERLGLADRAIEAWQLSAADDDSAWAAESRAHLNELTRRQKAPNDDLQSTRERLFDDVLPRLASVAERGASAEIGSVMAEAQSFVERLAAAPKDPLAANVFAHVRRAIDPASHLTRDDRAALWRGHLAYGEARRHYVGQRMDAAAPAFDAAARDLERGRSPLVLSAQLHLAIIAYRQRDLPGAERQLTALLPRMRDGSYASLVGRTAWTLGVIATQRGGYVEAEVNYRRALPAFADARETAFWAFVHLLLADNYDRRGEPERGWGDRLIGLAGSRRAGALLTSAQSALRLGWPYVAAVLQEDAATLARSEPQPINLIDALRSQAQTRIRLGEFEAAARLVASARVLLASQSDSTWDRLRAEVDLVEAQLVAASHGAASAKRSASTNVPPATSKDVAATTPADAIPRATRAYDYFASSKATRRLPETLLTRARLERHAGRAAAARADLLQAVEILIGERDRLTPGPERLAFAETARRIGEELVSIEVAAAQHERALIAVDRLRSWDLGAAMQANGPLDLATLRAALPPDTVIVYYAIGDRESFAWRVRRESVDVRRLALNREEMQRLISAPPADRLGSPAMRRVAELAAQPIVETLKPGGRLIVVPDGPLHALAFAALPGRNTRFLVEEQAISLVPSLSALLAASRQLHAMSTDVQAIVAVGNPVIGRTLWPELPDLRGAAIEARRVAALYPSSQTLIAGEATSDALAAALAAADVLHFAGHAVVNDLYPEDSALGILNRTGQPLTATALRTLPLRRLQLAVLAACEGFGGRSTRDQGPMSLARALLQAGVPTVLANRWLVDDRAAVTFATAFHGAYRQIPDAAAALQRAQVSMIHSDDPQLRAPSAWAGWSVIGGTARLRPEPADSRQ